MRKKHIVFSVLCVMGFVWTTATPLPAPLTENSNVEEVDLSNNKAGGGADLAFTAPKEPGTINQEEYDQQYGTPKKSPWEKMKFWKKDQKPEKKQKDLLKKVTNRIDSLDRVKSKLEKLLTTYDAQSTQLSDEIEKLNNTLAQGVHQEDKAPTRKRDRFYQAFKQKAQDFNTWYQTKKLNRAQKRLDDLPQIIEGIKNKKTSVRAYSDTLISYQTPLANNTLSPEKYAECEQTLAASKKLISQTKENLRSAQKALKAQMVVLQDKIEGMLKSVDAALKNKPSNALIRMKEALTNVKARLSSMGSGMKKKWQSGYATAKEKGQFGLKKVKGVFGRKQSASLETPD
jgi:ElaB/YqjD/DUF883 family membrane-anchored ribosome-binding protein